jgi:hypothetical protein
MSSGEVALVPDGSSGRDECWLRYLYLAQAVDDNDRRRGPPQRSTELIEEELMDHKNPEPLWTPTEVATTWASPCRRCTSGAASAPAPRPAALGGRVPTRGVSPGSSGVADHVGGAIA